MSLFSRIAGVVGAFFQIGGPAGPAWKSDSGNIDARTPADSAFVNVRGLDPVINDDLVTKRYGDLNYGGASSIHAGSIDVVLAAHSDYVLGVVTGLSATPLKVLVQAIYEESVTVQSGMVYDVVPYQLNSAGFNWQLRVLGNEFWPGPGSVTLKVDYLWSST